MFRVCMSVFITETPPYCMHGKDSSFCPNLAWSPTAVCAGAYGEGMKMELLQLATLLIRRAPQQLVQHRKELIKFGWNHLKRDDSAAKYYAFLNVCHFLDAYQAPEKIVLQASAGFPHSLPTANVFMCKNDLFQANAISPFSPTLNCFHVHRGQSRAQVRAGLAL